MTRKMIKMDAYTIRARSFMRVIFKKVIVMVKEKFCFQTDVNMKETSFLVVSRALILCQISEKVS